jgi:poly(A) polymerase
LTKPPMQIDLTSAEQHILHTIAAAANELQYPCYLVGGYVRDKLLGRPVKDIDVVCIGSGIALAGAVAERFSPKPKVTVFKTFGTAMLRHGDWEIEFVGARKESYDHNSRKPVVEDGTLEDDQQRRDFTVNALAISLNRDDYGQLLDPFGGSKHLEQRILKTPLDPDITFSDDPLRMMRAIRFASQLRFHIEPGTLAAIARNRDRIAIVSQERITDELNKIILSSKPSIGFKLLFDTGLLERVFPEMADLHGIDVVNGHGHKDNFYHTLQVLDNLATATDDLWLRWSAVLHDIAKPHTKHFAPKVGWTFHGHDAIGAKMVPQIFRKLKLPLHDRMKFVQQMVLLHLRPISLTNETVTDSAIRRLLFEAGDNIDSLMMLCEADITSKNKEKVKRYMKNFELVRQKLKEVEEKDKMRNWQPPIGGDEIMQAFGLRPGPEVGELKNAIRDAILDGQIHNDRESARAFMLEKGREMGLTPHVAS